MAEENLGTLQYEMLVSDDKLEASLTAITKQLEDADTKWRNILSGKSIAPTIDPAKIQQSATAVTQIEQTEGQKQLSAWQRFMKAKMAEYMKLEGSHKAAMARISAEWAKMDTVAKNAYNVPPPANTPSSSSAQGIKEQSAAMKKLLADLKEFHEFYNLIEKSNHPEAWKTGRLEMYKNKIKEVSEQIADLELKEKLLNSTQATGGNSVNNNRDAVKTSIKQLKADLKEQKEAYEKLSETERKSVAGQAQLASINKMNEKMALYTATLKQLTAERKKEEQEEAKRIAQMEREAKVLQKINEQQATHRAKLQSSINNATANSVAKLDAENDLLKYDKSVLKNDAAEIDKITKAINQNREARASLIKSIREQGEAQKRVTERQKLVDIRNATPKGTTANLDAQYNLLRFDRNAINDDAAGYVRLTRLINENREARRQLTLTDKQAATERKLQIAIDSQAVGSIGRLKAEIALYAAQIKSISPATQAGRDEILRLNNAINANRDQIQALQPSEGVWRRLTSAIRTYVTAYLSVQGAMGLGKAIYNQTKDLDQLSFGMKTVIKSSVELAETQKFLSDVAVNYGGDLLTLSERYIKFRAATQQSNMTAGETQKIFDSMSKAAGTLGLKTDELSGVYLALEQMISKGKVTTEELRRQLGERLPGAFGIMASALGVTIPQLDKMMKKGEVMSKEALPKFAEAVEKAYGIESLKKVDTLAAAQGRMSTQFTQLIGSMEASDGFKKIINNIADFLGFVKENMNVIAMFTKVLSTLAVAYTLNKVRLAAALVIQYASVVATGQQVSWTNKLTTAQLASAEASYVNARSISALNTAMKGFGGIWGILANLIVTAGIAFFAFRNKAKGASEEMKSFQEESAKAVQKVNTLMSVLKTTEAGTYTHTEAMRQLNEMAIKYNSTLATENGLTKDSIALKTELLDKIDQELKKKYFASDMDKAEKAKNDVLNPLRDQFIEIFKNEKDGYDKAMIEYNKFLDIAKNRAGNAADIFQALQTLDAKVVKQANTLNGISLSDAAAALKKYADEIERIKKNYGTPTGKDDFDIEILKKAKAEFDAKEKLDKVNADNRKKGITEEIKLESVVYSEGVKNYEEYLRSLLAKADTYGNNSALKEAIGLELSDLLKEEAKGAKTRESMLDERNEAIKKLNDRYLANQEEFANFDAGIASGRIAAMEDSLEKEKKLNALAYENRMKQIEKEKIDTLALLNDANGTKIGDKGEITDFDAIVSKPEVQEEVKRAGEDYLRKQAQARQAQREADLKSEQDWAHKIKEIYRDINDQFLSGLDKERAAINEKYDDWAKKAMDAGDWNLVAKIFSARNNAEDELYRKYEIDQLDFKREIEYKKNEIALNGTMNQRKLDKANFDTYVKYEREKIKLLKASKSEDMQEQGRLAEESLATEERLFALKQEVELRQQIIDGAKKLSSILAEQLGLTQEESAVLNDLSGVFDDILSGNFISAGVGLFKTVIDTIGASKSNPVVTQLEKINKLLEQQDSILNNLSGSKWFALAKEKLDTLRSGVVQSTADLKKSLSETSIGALFGNPNNLDPKSKQYQSEQTAFVSRIKSLINDDKKGLDSILFAWQSGALKLNEAQVKTLQDGIQKQKEIIELQAEIYARTLGFTADDVSSAIFDGIDQGLKLGENGLGGFANNFGQLVKKALMTSILEATNTRITTDFLSKYNEFMQNSEVGPNGEPLTESELSILENIYKGIVQGAEKDSENISKITDKYIKDTTGADSSSSGISKSIQALTEDTGRRLEGMLNTIRETGVINMGNTKALVESSQAIQAYAAQQLSHLRNIDISTAAQLAILNDVLTTAAGTGGKGLGVYIKG